MYSIIIKLKCQEMVIKTFWNLIMSVNSKKAVKEQEAILKMMTIYKIKFKV